MARIAGTVGSDDFSFAPLFLADLWEGEIGFQENDRKGRRRRKRWLNQPTNQLLSPNTAMH